MQKDVAPSCEVKQFPKDAGAGALLKGREAASFRALGGLRHYCYLMAGRCELPGEQIAHFLDPAEAWVKEVRREEDFHAPARG